MIEGQLLLDTGIGLATSRAGEGSRSTILLHGWSCRRSHWQPLMTHPPQGTSLLTVDLPGHGESSGVNMQHWSVAQLGRMVAALVHSNGDEEAVLVGHSMGGAVAMEAARLLPRLAAVVLVDTFVIPYGDLDEATAHAIQAPFHEDFAAAISDLVEHNVGANMTEADRLALKTDMASARQDAMLPLWSDLLRWNPEPAFNDIQCPLYAINGDLIPAASKTRCAGRVTVLHIPGAGHFPHQEMPREFRAVLTELLGQLD